jgi:hypothetical protein
MMQKNDLKGRDGGKWQKFKHRAFVMPQPSRIFSKV